MRARVGTERPGAVLGEEQVAGRALLAAHLAPVAAVSEPGLEVDPRHVPPGPPLALAGGHAVVADPAGLAVTTAAVAGVGVGAVAAERAVNDGVGSVAGAVAAVVDARDLGPRDDLGIAAVALVGDLPRVVLVIEVDDDALPVALVVVLGAVDAVQRVLLKA